VVSTTGLRYIADSLRRVPPTVSAREARQLRIKALGLGGLGAGLMIASPYLPFRPGGAPTWLSVGVALPGSLLLLGALSVLLSFEEAPWSR